MLEYLGGDISNLKYENITGFKSKICECINYKCPELLNFRFAKDNYCLRYPDLSRSYYVERVSVKPKILMQFLFNHSNRIQKEK